MSPTPHSVKVGDHLPQAVVTPTRAQLFLFSSATNNAHRIHYDRTWAVDVEGLADVVVHGPLQGALMAKVVTDWLGDDGRLIQSRVRHLKPAFPDDELVFDAEVTAVTHTEVSTTLDFEVVEVRDGEAIGRGWFVAVVGR
ncbi:MAG: MaoC/PaaZ C-terminal domain-containing protein [Ilumatobacteraceae bacterium]